MDGILESEAHELTATVFKGHQQDYHAAQRDISLELGHRGRGDVSFRLLDEQGEVLVNCDPNNRLQDLRFQAPDANPTASWCVFKTIETQNDRNPVRVYAERVTGQDGRVYIAQSGYLLDRATHSLTVLRWVCVLGLICAIVAAAVGGRIVANRCLRPIQVMIAKAQATDARNLGERIPRTKNGDELDCLAETLNGMLDRVQWYISRLQQFTADASHEFRSPLAVLRGNAEVALTRRRSETELREVIEESIEQYDRLGRIAEDLLLLARADAGHLPLRREKMQLDQAITDAVDLYAPLAQDQNIILTFTNRKEIWLDADGSYLRRLIGNLIDNAIKYSGAGTRVGVSLASENGAARITVADNGPGIPPDHLARVFERFYRLDASRSVQGPGGAGLGLSICRTIAEAHGGGIDISSALGEGTCVTVLIPLNYSPDQSG